ncbi:MAG: S16 family serine protease [Arhodomonas sp.]|nr:S16 family serine protease [Arhodomonas sp.]
MRDMVRYYTREAGVRNLEREIAKICAQGGHSELVAGGPGQAPKVVRVTTQNLDKYLGVRQFRLSACAEEENQVGQVTGLAWTEVGGELLTIEAAVVPGKGKTASRPAQLGEVMQESIQAALTVVRSRAQALGIDRRLPPRNAICISTSPRARSPKDGPSAGIGMCTALVSALTGIPVRADVAMTGEITLRGEVLPIGGLKEKLLAAHRGGITTVLIPEENRKDLTEVSKDVKGKLDIRPVRWIDQVFELALVQPPQPRPTENGELEPAEVKTETKGRRKREGARTH